MPSQVRIGTFGTPARTRETVVRSRLTALPESRTRLRLGEVELLALVQHGPRQVTITLPPSGLTSLNNAAPADTFVFYVATRASAQSAQRAGARETGPRPPR